MSNADVRAILLENATRAILDYFSFVNVQVINADNMGAGFYSVMPMNESLQKKLDGLLLKGFSNIESEDFSIYSKEIAELGNANIKFNKTNSRLTVSINV